MPPKKRTRPAATRVVPVLRDDAGPPPAERSGSGDTCRISLQPLPDTFHEAVQRLVELVSCAMDNNVTMFKLEMANVLPGQCAADVVAGLSATAQQNICVVEPLCEVRLSDLPDNGCSVLFDQRQYAEALLHAARAHFAFVEFDRRLIFTSTVGMRDPAAMSQLLYAFSYVTTTTAAGRTESSVVRTIARPPAAREVINRRRTVAAVPRRDYDDDMGESSIGDELEMYRNKLNRDERSLLEASQSLADEDMRLPDTALDSSLGEVPVPQLGTALHAVLPRVQAAAVKRAASQRKPTRGAALKAVLPHVQAAAAADKPAAIQQSPPRGAISHPAIVAARARNAPSAGRTGKRRHSVSPEPVVPETSDIIPAPSKPAASPPTPSRKSSAHLPEAEADQLVAFFQRLNGAQSEQSRISLTCSYAKMRYGHDVASGVMYRLVEAARHQGAGPAAAAGPEPLTGNKARETALTVFAELDVGHSEQSRVAYTLKYMRVQHALKLDANTLFGWLGQGSKKPSAKRAKLR